MLDPTERAFIVYIILKRCRVTDFKNIQKARQRFDAGITSLERYQLFELASSPALFSGKDAFNLLYIACKHILTFETLRIRLVIPI